MFIGTVASILLKKSTLIAFHCTVQYTFIGTVAPILLQKSTPPVVQ